MNYNYITRRLPFLACMFLNFSILLAQNKRIDSLKNELIVSSLNSVARVDLLNKITAEIYEDDIESGLNFVHESIKISQEINYEKGLAASYYLKGSIRLNKAEILEARDHFLLALEVYKALDAKVNIAECLNGIGKTYYYESNYEESLTYWKQFLKESEDINDLKQVSAALNNIATAYSDLGNNEQALIFYEQSLTIDEKRNDKKGVAASLNNIGAIYFVQSNYPLVLKYYNDALYIYEELGDKSGIAITTNNIGNIYSRKEELEKALTYYKKALSIAQGLRTANLMSPCLANISRTYGKLEKYDEALIYINKALILSKKTNSKSDIAFCYLNKGELEYNTKNFSNALETYKKARTIALEIKHSEYLCVAYLGVGNTLIEKKRYNLAYDNVINALKLAVQMKSIEREKDAYNMLSEVYEKTGKYKKAYESHQAYSKLNDSLLNKENIKRITQLEYEYQFRKRIESADKREVKLTNDVLVSERKLVVSQKQKLLVTIGFLSFILILGIIIFLLRIRNLKSRSENHMIEQRLLRMQMNPHFTFNTLARIQHLIDENPELAKNYLIKFSRILVSIFESSTTSYISLEKELQSLNEYVELQRIHFPKEFEFSIDLNEIDPKKIFVPGMLFQPIVENSIKHGFINSDHLLKICLELKKEKSYISCSVEDNGKGLSTSNLHHDASSSTQLISNFLSKVTKRKYTILNKKDTLDEQTGVIVNFSIPYKLSLND